VSSDVLRKLLKEERTRGGVEFITLNIDGVGKKHAFIKEIQHDPISLQIQHVDFHIVHAGEKIYITLPIVLVGEPVGVRRGGVLDQILHEIEVEAYPKDIPPHIEVNVEHLDIGDTIMVRDLPDQDKLRYTESPDTPVATILAPRVTVEEEKKVEEEEAVPPTEEAPPTEE